MKRKRPSSEMVFFFVGMRNQCDVGIEIQYIYIFLQKITIIIVVNFKQLFRKNK